MTTAMATDKAHGFPKAAAPTTEHTMTPVRRHFHDLVTTTEMTRDAGAEDSGLFGLFSPRAL